MASQLLTVTPPPQRMMIALVLMCTSHVTSLLALDNHLPIPAFRSSVMDIVDAQNEYVRTTVQEKDIKSQPHLGKNSRSREEGEQSVTYIVPTIYEKQIMISEEGKMENTKDKIYHNAEIGKFWNEDVRLKKVTEENLKKNKEEKFDSINTEVPPLQAQTSGWFFEAETVNVTAIPILSHPLRHPRPSHQHMTDEEAKLTLEFQIEGHHLILDLHPTRELLGASYRDPVVGTMKDSGMPSACEFQGSVRGMPESWTALSLCKSIWGVVVGRGKELVVEPILSTATLEGPHRVFSANLLQHSPGVCGVKDDVKKNSKSENSISSSISGNKKDDAPFHRKRREALHGGPIWTNKTTRFVELVLVADNSFYLSYLSNTIPRCRGIVNIVNALFRPVGVVVVLTHLEIWDKKDQIDVTKESNKTLDNMKEYRKKLLETLPNVPNDNTQLLTTVDFDGITIGKAAMNGMCSYEDSVGIVQDQKGAMASVAQTIAHELGHNLGLGHDEDDDDCQCDSTSCIMNTVMNSYSPQVTWSSCSKRNLTRSFKGFSFDCLKNAPSQQYSGSICGNGVTEEDEQCDCGPPEFCTNPCCFAKSCQLVPNATCASGSCCDTQTCKPKPVWTLCRAATAECDIPEYCSGSSEFCPPDIIERDGTYCNGGKGHCYKGECGSHDGRCQQVWGDGVSSGSSQCYTQHNQEGGSYGNCGILDKKDNTFQPCSLHDAPCGTLHCHTNADVKPKFGIVSYTAWSKDNHDCRGIFSSNKIPPSYWLSPNGASCGDGKMCVNQRCVPIPGSGIGMIFWMVLFLLLIIFCCLWKPLLWWWNKRGRAWIAPTFPCCAACLDTCCCPLISKICQLTTHIGTVRKQKKPSQNEISLGNGEANGNLISHLDQSMNGSLQTNPWGDEDKHLTVTAVTYTPKNFQLSSNSNTLHNTQTVDGNSFANHTSVILDPGYVSDAMPILNHMNPASNWPISSDVGKGQLPGSSPTSPHTLSDDEVIDKLSELTQNLGILSGKENKSVKLNSDLNISVKNSERDLDTHHQMQPQASCDSPVKIIPVRRAPSPPVQKSRQDGGITFSNSSAESVIPLGVCPTTSLSPESSIPQIPEPDTSLRPESPIPKRQEYITYPRSEPIIPSRPDCNAPSRSEPIIPPRPEPVIPPRPEFTRLTKEESSIPPRPEPIIPPRPEPIIPPRPEPIIPPRPESIITPRSEPVIPPRPEFMFPRQEPIVPPRP